MMINSRLLWLILGISSIALLTTCSGGESLQDYARQCDAATGVTVPKFDCDSESAVEVPGSNDEADGVKDDKCDEPNRLNKECDPGSRFQVLPDDNPDAFVVAHCRKQRGEPGKYGDIAVIQHNQQNGATCFYQALGRDSNKRGTLNGLMEAPLNGGSQWLSPANTAAIGCGGCHDNGPLIRSPYLTQITGTNSLPGAGDRTFNSFQPYTFVGADFASWKAYSVEVKEYFDTLENRNKPVTCTSCHRMGVSNVAALREPDKHGTAIEFGIISTSKTEDAKNPHSPQSPIWMTLEQRMKPQGAQYSQANADMAKAIKECALRWRENPLPNGDDCKITQFTGIIAATPRWGDFKDDGCKSIGIRQWSSVLHDIPAGASWEATCTATSATVQGQSFSSPTRCKNTGTNIWGEFDVSDSSCTPNWGDFKDDGCKAIGIRQFSSILNSIPPGVSWEATCAATPATVQNQFFSSPTRCKNTGTNIWGEFDVSDSSCAPSWGDFKDDGCKAIGIRQFSSILNSIPSGVSWEATCAATPATVQNQFFSSPSRCKNTGTNIWGEFDVSDSSCAPHWGEFQKDSCRAIGIRQWSSVLHDIPPGVSWEATCAATPATVQGQTFSSPTRCKNTGTNIWGEFDVSDSSCVAHWGSFKNDGCKRSGIRQWSSVLHDIPSGVSWEATCATTSATVQGQFFSSPSRCKNTSLNIWGEFDVSDSSCP